jgi:uridine kinase
MNLGPGEPEAGPWTVEPLEVLVRSLAGARVIAVDGRGGSGKTVLASRLAGALKAAVVHSDDVAWNHGRFGWDDLMRDGILSPFRAGEPVRYRPPAWDRLGREGVIVVEPARSLIIEGVGVSRRSLAPYVDLALWVQSDYVEAKARGIRRDMATEGRTEEGALQNWDEWEAEEVPFLLDDRPWERADLIVTTALPHDADTEVVIARPSRETPA